METPTPQSRSHAALGEDRAPFPSPVPIFFYVSSTPTTRGRKPSSHGSAPLPHEVETPIVLTNRWLSVAHESQRRSGRIDAHHGVYSIFMYGRCRITIDPRIPTIRYARKVLNDHKKVAL